MEYNGLRVCAPDKACMHLWVMCARALSFIYLEIMEFARLFSFFMVLSFIMELCNEYSSIAWECWWRIVNWPWPWPCSTYHARARAHTHTHYVALKKVDFNFRQSIKFHVLPIPRASVSVSCCVRIVWPSLIMCRKLTSALFAGRMQTILFGKENG